MQFEPKEKISKSQANRRLQNPLVELRRRTEGEN